MPTWTAWNLRTRTKPTMWKNTSKHLNPSLLESETERAIQQGNRNRKSNIETVVVFARHYLGEDMKAFGNQVLLIEGNLEKSLLN